MTYVRRFNYRGIEPLQANVLRILERDLPDELDLIAEEYDTDALPVFAEYLGSQKKEPLLPCIVVEPDEDDAVTDESGLLLGEENVLDITIVLAPTEELEQVTLNIMRYKRAVMNVLWSADQEDLLEGIDHTPATWDLRGGRYIWTQANNLYGRAVRNLKLVAKYEEVYNDG
jgi:hypothetical protein